MRVFAALAAFPVQECEKEFFNCNILIWQEKKCISSISACIRTSFMVQSGGNVHGNSALPIRVTIFRVRPARYADPGVFSNRLGAGSITAKRAASVALRRLALLRK